MPNWVYNTVSIEGDRKKIESLVSHIAERIGVADRESLSMEEILEVFNRRDRHSEGAPVVLLSSFEKEPYPETFLELDTCNHPYGEGLRVGEKDMSGNEITEDLVEQYRRASDLQKEKYGAVGWYDYNCLHFGVKWDSAPSGFSYRDGVLRFDVDTPWSTPDFWFSRVTREWGVTLTVHAEEEFRNFPPATFVYEDGELRSEEYEDRYFVFGEEFEIEDRENAIEFLRENVGSAVDIPENPTDEYLFSTEFHDKVSAWTDTLPDDDSRKMFPCFFLG